MDDDILNDFEKLTVPNDYLEIAINAAVGMRKILTLDKQLMDGSWASIRPQVHVFIVSPFGTFKSTIFKRLEAMLKNDFIFIEEFTKAAYLGTIDGNTKEFMPGLSQEAGGKVIGIDEWNTIGYDARYAMLSSLENQRISKRIAYKVHTETKPKVGRKFCTVTAKDNTIKGRCQFTVIANAMYFPEDIQSQQKEDALLSRFIPLVYNPDINYLEDEMLGKATYNLKDGMCPDLEKIQLPYALHEKITHYTVEKTLKSPFIKGLEEDRRQGLWTRVTNDIIRLYSYLEIQNAFKTGKNPVKTLVLGHSEPLPIIDHFFDIMLAQHIGKEYFSTRQHYNILKALYPNETNAFYARRLSVSERWIQKIKG